MRMSTPLFDCLPAPGNFLRLAEEIQRQRHRIDAEVECRPAAKVRPEEAAVPVFVVAVGQLGFDLPYLADRAAVDQLLGGADRRQEARPHRLHREAFLPGRRRCDAFGVGNRRRQRLLDQHRLAVGDGLQRLLGMQARWGSRCRSRRCPDRRPWRRDRHRCAPPRIPTGRPWPCRCRANRCRPGWPRAHGKGRRRTGERCRPFRQFPIETAWSCSAPHLARL